VTVAQLAGLTRIALTCKVGCKTFVTLKLAQGVPRTTVRQATGYRTESSCNCYVGIDETELVEPYRKAARQVAKKTRWTQCNACGLSLLLAACVFTLPPL
jgi:hypothetical protein